MLILGLKGLTGLNEGGKTGNIAFQLILQQSCTFLLPILPKHYPTKICGGMWKEENFVTLKKK